MSEAARLQKMTARFAPTEHQRRPVEAVGCRPTRPRQAGRGVESPRRAVPAPGLGRQRSDAAGPRARHDAGRPRAPALLPDQQGPVVAARSRPSRSCPARRRNPRARTSIRTARRKAELERWIQSLPEADRAKATGFFTTIRRSGGTLQRGALQRRVSGRARARGGAAARGGGAGGRADAQDLPDQARRRAALERLLRQRRRVDGAEGRDRADDSARTRSTKTSCSTTRRRSSRSSRCRTKPSRAKLQKFAGELQDIEDHLPIDPKHRNPKLGALAPIVVVNEIFAAGDANRGVQTAAFNLPNDERVTREKGAKRVMLKNVQDAKFAKTLVPISKVVLSPADQKDAVVRGLLHAHRRARADARARPAQHHRRRPPDDGPAGDEGSLQFPRGSEGRHLGPLRHPVLIDKGVLPKSLERPLYTTYLASAFRSIRFGINEAHGRGVAVQMNYLLDQGGFQARPDGTFAVDLAKVKAGVAGLTREIMTIQAEGDYNEGRRAPRSAGRRAAARQTGARQARRRAGGHRAPLHDGGRTRRRSLFPADGRSSCSRPLTFSRPTK